MQEHPVDFVAASFVRRDLEGKVYPGGCQYEDTLITDGDYAWRYIQQGAEYLCSYLEQAFIGRIFSQK